MPRGVIFAINGMKVTSPDEETWAPLTIGTALDGLQRRSPYRQLEWLKQVGDSCDLDWFAYDNTRLDSLTCRPYNKLDEYETYTDVVCESVTFRQRRGVGNEIVASFKVNVGV